MEIASVNLENKNKNDDDNGNLHMYHQEQSHGTEENETMREDTVESLSGLLRANKSVLLVGGFSCKEANI